MKPVLVIAGDLLREAAARRWFLGLFAGITLVVLVFGVALRMDVVDGALAATRLFGRPMHHDIRAAETVMSSVFLALAYLVFYGGLAFGVVACADFAPELLAPGRIEHLLALPVRRWQLLLGTYLGVLALAAAGALYGAGAFTLLLSVKSGVWTARPIVAGLLAAATFGAVYAAMLAAAVFVRSAALSAAIGAALVVFGIIAGQREDLAALFEEGVSRALFLAATAPAPRISQLANHAADFAASRPVAIGVMLKALAGLGTFAGGCILVGMWKFERKDF